jgi:hypothetical protein
MVCTRSGSLWQAYPQGPEMVARESQEEYPAITAAGTRQGRWCHGPGWWLGSVMR